MGATRRTGVLALLVLATIVAIIGMTAVWVQRQVLEREEWVDTTVELLEDPENERAHDVFDEVLGEDSGDVTVDLQPLIQKAAERGGLLGRAAAALPEDAGQLQVLRPDQLETAQKAVKLLRALAIVLVLLAIALYVIASWSPRIGGAQRFTWAWASCSRRSRCWRCVASEGT
jgi:hypothetical protein